MSAKRYLFYISQNYSYAILRPLQNIILARGDQVAWFLEGKEVNASYLLANEIQLKSVNAVQQYKADVVFIPGNVVPSFISGIKVGVFHGFNSGKLNRRGFEDHFNIRGCFDLYCTQGPNTTLPFIELAKQHQHFSVKQTGWPALDPLFDLTNVSKGAKPIILMCSTFSRALTCAPHLFETVKRLSESGKWQWLIQFHPKMPKEIIEQYKSLESGSLSFIETDNVIPLLQQADVMVCDTSSVLMMFLMLNKPVVTFNNISPQDYMVDINDEDKLEESIEYALSYPAELKAKVECFIKDTHPYVDGESSQRVLAAADELLAGQNVAVKNKPLNLLRRFKMRKKLKYWQL
ncbi:CDP-glycerol glycerophosphotransferase family protein [Candidatus Colwellia aromaticivorans]|uniref:CDP-glycerol glycerophosphotransferase family protein n=1 Tax=Candidatus Colwellia aromaticivorans TaxID=2267621 RepID=UPI000DF320BB|nr:CDP-glycerol glycerophosphotransferase family protein [Candidatus Colwellia aromaticivorans]